MKEMLFFLVFAVNGNGILSTSPDQTEIDKIDPNLHDYDYHQEDQSWIFNEENLYQKSIVNIAQELYLGYAEEIEDNFAFSPLR